MADETQGQIQATEKDSNVISILPYILGLVVAAVIYLLKKDDRFVKFHALQAIILDVVASAVGVILVIVAYVIMFVGVFALPLGLAAGGGNGGAATAGVLAAPFIIIAIAWVLIVAYFGIILLTKLYCAYKAYKGEVFRLPLIGRFVERHV